MKKKIVAVLLVIVSVFSVSLTGCAPKRIDKVALTNTSIANYDNYSYVGVSNNKNLDNRKASNLFGRVFARAEEDKDGIGFSDVGYLSAAGENQQAEYVNYIDRNLQDNYFIQEYGDFGDYAYIKYVVNEFKDFCSCRIYGEDPKDSGTPLNNEMNTEGYVYVLNKKTGELFSIDSIVYDLFVQATNQAVSDGIVAIDDVDAFCESNYFFYRAFWFDDSSRNAIATVPALAPVILPEVNSNKFVMYLKPSFIEDSDDRIPREHRPAHNQDLAFTIYDKYLHNLYEIEVTESGVSLTNNKTAIPFILFDSSMENEPLWIKYSCVLEPQCIDRFNNVAIAGNYFDGNIVTNGNMFAILNINGSLYRPQRTDSLGSLCYSEVLRVFFMPQSERYFGADARLHRISVQSNTIPYFNAGCLVGFNFLKGSGNTYYWLSGDINTSSYSPDMTAYIDIKVVSIIYDIDESNGSALNVNVEQLSQGVYSHALFKTPYCLYGINKAGVIGIYPYDGEYSSLSAYQFFGNKQVVVQSIENEHKDILVLNITVGSQKRRVAVDPTTQQFVADGIDNLLNGGFVYLKTK